MNKQAKRIILSFSVGICLMLFVLLAIFCSNFATKIDLWFGNVINKISSNSIINFFKIFTYLGSIYALAIIVLSLLFLKKKTYGIIAIISLAVAGLMGVIVKYIIRRPRPETMHIEEIGYSFPSAHAMLSFLVLGFIIYVILKLIKNKSLKIILTILLSLTIICVGVSRVILNVHYFTDILAGWLIAYPILLASVLMCNHALKNPIRINKKHM